jgi:hypothetical protein
MAVRDDALAGDQFQQWVSALENGERGPELAAIATHLTKRASVVVYCHRRDIIPIQGVDEHGTPFINMLVAMEHRRWQCRRGQILGDQFRHERNYPEIPHRLSLDATEARYFARHDPGVALRRLAAFSEPSTEFDPMGWTAGWSDGQKRRLRNQIHPAAPRFIAAGLAARLGARSGARLGAARPAGGPRVAQPAGGRDLVRMATAAGAPPALLEDLAERGWLREERRAAATDAVVLDAWRRCGCQFVSDVDWRRLVPRRELAGRGSGCGPGCQLYCQGVRRGIRTTRILSCLRVVIAIAVMFAFIWLMTRTI